MKKLILNYENSVNKLTTLFANRYFEDADFYWVGDEIGGTIEIADYYFNFDDILNFIKNDYSEEQVFEYYDYALDETMAERSPVNIKNYLKMIPSKK